MSSVPVVGFMQSLLQRVVAGKTDCLQTAYVVGPVDDAVWLALVPRDLVFHPGAGSQDFHNIADPVRGSGSKIEWAGSVIHDRVQGPCAILDVEEVAECG